LDIIWYENFRDFKVKLDNFHDIFTASFFPACFIVAASYAGCDETLVIILFTLAMGTMGGFYPGMKVNALDLSPNYAGSLMALTNGIGATTGFIG
jgi:MFS transporter, ACS family, solute carrier family 17 (sodium-dependent inorganic phosphate cotransporter), other